MGMNNPLRLDLHPVAWRADNISRFRYTAQGTPVFGRVEEQAALRRFLEPDHGRFRWWLLGGPGGMGKSRLAFELALGADENGWEAGFLPRGSGPGGRCAALEQSPDNWPLRPTLVILDYIAGEEEQAGAALARLARRGDRGPPLRLLLLERESSPEAHWWTRFWGEGERLSALEESQHARPLTLSPLSPLDMIRVVEQWPGEKPPADQWRPLLARLDFGGRPLYAAFLADALESALAGGREQWDQLSLVRGVLQREEKHWTQCGVTEEDRHLLLLSTLCGGLDTSRQDLPPLAATLLRTAAQVQQPEFADRCLTMTGHAITNTQPRLFPLEPDLLGELLLLERLQPKPPLIADPNLTLRQETLAAAWRLTPWGVFATLSRATQDFPTHPGLFPLAAEAPDDSLGRILWAKTAVNVIAHAGAVQTSSAKRLYQQLASLSAAHPGEAPLREAQASGAFNLILHYGEAGELTQARRLYDTLTALSAAHPGESPLREEQAKSAFNLITDYGKAGELTQARELYDALTALTAAHPGEAPLREEQAKGAVNLMNAYGNAGELTQARELCDALTALSAAHANEAFLREAQAKGAYNLIVNYVKAGELEQARELHERVVDLLKAHMPPEWVNKLQAFIDSIPRPQ